MNETECGVALNAYSNNWDGLEPTGGLPDSAGVFWATTPLLRPVGQDSLEVDGI